MKSSRSVYSTDVGRLCPGCSQPIKACRCSKAKQAPSGDGIVRIKRETKGRKGKGVTLVTGVPLAGDELKLLATKLKQLCGTGGTVKDGVVEIQGEHRERLQAYLQDQGYKVKIAGG